jgi:hypothetical protein
MGRAAEFIVALLVVSLATHIVGEPAALGAYGGEHIKEVTHPDNGNRAKRGKHPHIAQE